MHCVSGWVVTDGGDLVFIGGAPRSGTTLLRAIIGASSDIACGPELRVIPSLCSLTENILRISGETLSASYGVSGAHLDRQAAIAISSFLRPLKAKTGAARAAEKTPTNALHFKTLRRVFPKARIVSIVRDGRDVVSSLLSMNWRDDHTGEKMAVTTCPHMAANLWVTSVANDFDMRGDQYFYSLHYEDLVRDPAKEIGALFDFMAAPTPNLALFHNRAFDALEGENEFSASRVAEPIDTSSIGRWRNDLNPDQIANVEAVAHPWLKRCGYV
ncbi:sulfotransferase family protein [Hyphococcus sp.]|uniref:sulfotransferase family protein n=1 Tax=Hyphococcus sp. TaxID=2038636 RepID=UPI0020821FA8|nr:MAG: hypothetical protein DHS20C04_13370 [Marinicaulis sp.]